MFVEFDGFFDWWRFGKDWWWFGFIGRIRFTTLAGGVWFGLWFLCFLLLNGGVLGFLGRDAWFGRLCVKMPVIFL